ncbi:MAG: response regulator [Lachnospiraceae bacterium]|nr:response regulator [Lachnospiraceae bacterium]
MSRVEKTKDNITKDDISIYLENQEYVANKYVMKCFTVSILLYIIAFFLNILGVFVIDQDIMRAGVIPSLIIYAIVLISTRFISLSNEKTKYYILFTIVLVFTIMSVSITYHLVLISLLPFLYATLYSSRRVMIYVYILTVVGTIITVYGGYYYGLCDANMTLLTTGSLDDYVTDGQFNLTTINPNPLVNLMIFFVLPRCLIYIAFAAVCSSIFKIVSGSIERARLTEELAKAKEEAENASKAKSQFLARMSHEIRTPINAVIGMNEMIIRESQDDNIQKYASDVKDSSKVLLDIINELLDSSKIESGMMELVPVQYRMDSLLGDLYNMIFLRADEKGLKLEFDIDPDMPRGYFGDDTRIKQVIINLLTNAVKYTNEGTVTLKASCTAQGENAIIHIEVKDTGIGFKPENLENIFGEFKRFDMSRNRNIEGTGLGMNIVQQLLKLMDSELKVVSEYEKGSEFSFDLKQQIVDREPIGDFKKTTEKAEKEEAELVEFKIPDAKILVVDDNLLNLKVFTRLVKHTEAQITEATSGMECLELLRANSYDVVFLDHMMPEMDGIETLHVIKEEKLCESTPIIMLTANAISGDKERYLAEGFDDFISKPVIPKDLDQMLLHYLVRNR